MESKHLSKKQRLVLVLVPTVLIVLAAEAFVIWKALQPEQMMDEFGYHKLNQAVVWAQSLLFSEGLVAAISVVVIIAAIGYYSLKEWIKRGS